MVTGNRHDPVAHALLLIGSGAGIEMHGMYVNYTNTVDVLSTYYLYVLLGIYQLVVIGGLTSDIFKRIILEDDCLCRRV